LPEVLVNANDDSGHVLSAIAHLGVSGLSPEKGKPIVVRVILACIATILVDKLEKIVAGNILS
jgi:hypothetical protein